VKDVSKLISIFLFFSLLIAARGPVTFVPVAAVLPTQTLLPTNTSIPEPCTTPSLSQAEQIFTIPSRQAGLVETPTAIATLIDRISWAKLRSLSERDMINLVHEMNEYSYQNFPPFGDWRTDGQFVAT
jgi:hypothetical protein